MKTLHKKRKTTSGQHVPIVFFITPTNITFENFVAAITNASKNFCHNGLVYTHVKDI